MVSSTSATWAREIGANRAVADRIKRVRTKREGDMGASSRKLKIFGGRFNVNSGNVSSRKTPKRLYGLEINNAGEKGGDKQKARGTLEKLLELWKDADPNLLLLKQAKAEYAKLQ